MKTRTRIPKINQNGASLLEVMIAMVILAIGFLGVMALSVALTNDNATASKINTGPAIAQAQVSQLDCLGASGIQGKFMTPCSSGSLKGCTESASGPYTYYTYAYTVNPFILNQAADNRNSVASCINSALTVGGGGTYPDSSPLNSLGVTLPYSVKMIIYEPVPGSATVINAQVAVSWRDITAHALVMNDTIS